DCRRPMARDTMAVGPLRALPAPLTDGACDIDHPLGCSPQAMCFARSGRCCQFGGKGKLLQMLVRGWPALMDLFERRGHVVGGARGTSIPMRSKLRRFRASRYPWFAVPAGCHAAHAARTGSATRRIAQRLGHRVSSLPVLLRREPQDFEHEL